jgi:uncharacterized protein (TIGR02246 family)
MNYYELEILRWEDEGGSIITFDMPISVSERIICQRMADYSLVRNKHDAKAMSMFFTEDADLIGTTGQVSKGREAIEQTFTQEHSTVYTKSQANRHISNIRFVSSDVIIVNGGFEVTDVISVEGKPLPDISGLFTYIWKWVKGEWLIAAYRSMSPVDVFHQELINKQKK